MKRRKEGSSASRKLHEPDEQQIAWVMIVVEQSFLSPGSASPPQRFASASVNAFSKLQAVNWTFNHSRTFHAEFKKCFARSFWRGPDRPLNLTGWKPGCSASVGPVGPGSDRHHTEF
jgi:hypothetical protein